MQLEIAADLGIADCIQVQIGTMQLKGACDHLGLNIHHGYQETHVYIKQKEAQ